MNEPDLITLPDDLQNEKSYSTSKTSARDHSYETESDIQNNNVREEENLDPASIEVTIGDHSTPLVFLFGPTSCGKSMTLIRLARYLTNNGYTIEPDRNFREGLTYEKKCNEFNSLLNTRTALRSTALTDFLLAKVYDNHGKAICQILEAPGEHYFDPNDVSMATFPPYMKQTFSNVRNRKIWVFITEPNWKVNPEIKKQYVRRIQMCKSQLMTSQDRSILLYNKVDKVPHLFTPKTPHYDPLLKSLNDEFVSLLGVFKNENILTSLWRKYDVTFVPFSTGYYTNQLNGELTYTQSEDYYPQTLWKTILANIRG